MGRYMIKQRNVGEHKKKEKERGGGRKGKFKVECMWLGNKMEPRRSPRFLEKLPTELVDYTDFEMSEEEIINIQQLSEEDQHNNAVRDKDNSMEENVIRTPVKWKKSRAKRPELSPNHEETQDECVDDSRDKEITETTIFDEEGALEKIKKTKFCRKQDDNPKKAVIRNSPGLFSEVVYHLSDDKKNWVEKAGFGIEKGRIDITEEDVFYVLGLPNGGKSVEQVTNEDTLIRMEEWQRTPTHSYIDRQLVKFDDLDWCVTYNWAAFLIQYLNVDTDEMHQDDDNDDGWDAWTNAENDTLEDDKIEEDITKMEENDCVEFLRDRAENIINLKTQFERDLRRAMERYPANEKLMIVKEVFSEIFNPKNTDCAEKESTGNFTKVNKELCNPNAEIDSDRASKDFTEEEIKNAAVTPDKQEVCNPNAEVDLDQASIHQLDIIDFLYLEQGIKPPNVTLSDKDKRYLAFIPSFSLGMETYIVQQVCQEINKDHEQILENEDYGTPKQNIKEKNTRIIKLGQYAKSPYINRIIDIHEKFTSRDISIWKYMSMPDRDGLEDLFVWNEIKSIREHLCILKNNETVFYLVIDTWSAILNDSENYKSDESPLRLFCSIGGLDKSVLNWKSALILKTELKISELKLSELKIQKIFIRR
ncbi:hypothetical protein AgCh_035244 [Apium graveolens]